MLTALCREQVVRTVFGDGVQPKKIHSATFDIFLEVQNPSNPDGRKLVCSGISIVNSGDGARLVANPAHQWIEVTHINLAMSAFGDLKW